MAYKPVSIDHVNIFVRNAERSHEWYTEVFGFHTQDTMMFPGTNRLRAAFLSCDPGHAHDIALFEVGEEAAGPQKKQVGLNHVAWRMANLEDLGEMYKRLKDKNVPVSVSDHTVSIGIYFSDMTPVPLLEMYTKGIRFHTGRVHARPAMEPLMELVRAGKFKPELVTGETADWEDAPEAVAGHRSKLVISRNH